MVINCALTKESKYHEAEADFHHLGMRGQKRPICGLKFASKEGAQFFAKAVHVALVNITGVPGMSLDALDLGTSTTTASYQ